MWRSVLLCLSLAACATFPQLDGTIEPASEDQPYPDLVPLEPILAEPETTRDGEEIKGDLASRAAGLQQEAAAITSSREDLDERADALRDASQSDPQEDDELATRAEELRKRAEALRQSGS